MALLLSVLAGCASAPATNVMREPSTFASTCASTDGLKNFSIDEIAADNSRQDDARTTITQSSPTAGNRAETDRRDALPALHLLMRCLKNPSASDESRPLRLEVEMKRYSYSMGEPGRKYASVEIAATIAKNGKALIQRDFLARAPVISSDDDLSASALEHACADLASQLSAWAKIESAEIS